MHQAFIALGSNMGDREKLIRAAITEMCAECGILRVSKIHETKPMYVTKQPRFLNAVVKIQTSLKPLELLEFLQEIEKRLGRERSREKRFGPRTIDLDILRYDDLKLENERLKIPHPRMLEREFVLRPLLEVF